MTSSENSPNRLSLSLVLLFIAAVSAIGQAPPASQTQILVTAVDKNGHFVSSLRSADLRVLEDGAPQEIANFQLLTEQSASIAIMIDASGSQERTLPSQKLAAASFVDSIIRDRDQAAVATFTGTLTVQQQLTNDVVLLRQAIARVQFVPPPGYIGGGIIVSSSRPTTARTPATLAGATAVWDAVLAVCDQLFSQSSGPSRRAIILLTDGEDTISKSKLSEAVDRAIRANVVVYAIGIGDTNNFGINKDNLQKLSERTGGRAFFPKKVSDLSAVLTEIGEELRTQYLIAFRSTTGSGARPKIKVEMVNPALRNTGIKLSYPGIAPGK